MFRIAKLIAVGLVLPVPLYSVTPPGQLVGASAVVLWVRFPLGAVLFSFSVSQLISGYVLAC